MTPKKMKSKWKYMLGMILVSLLAFLLVSWVQGGTFDKIAITLIIVIGVQGIYVDNRLHKHRRRRRFVQRPTRSLDEWYEEFYGETGLDKTLVKQVHEALANDIGVDPSQIRPTDRFTVELMSPENWLGMRDDLLELEIFAERRAREHEKKSGKKILPYKSAANTVGECIEELEKLIVTA